MTASKTKAGVHAALCAACGISVISSVCLLRFDSVSEQFDDVLASYRQHSRMWCPTLNKFAEGEPASGHPCLSLQLHFNKASSAGQAASIR